MGVIPIRGAFSLVELLAVIGIIAILVGLLLPMLARTKNPARCIQCANDLHQIGLAFVMYADDYKGYIMQRYYDFNRQGVKVGYGMKWYYDNMLLESVGNSSETILLTPA